MARGLFDLQFRLQKLDRNGDPLAKINQFVDWNLFRNDLEAAREAARTQERKSDAGRPPADVILLFKMLVLQSLYNLSDDAVEQQSLDRLTFMRFLGLEIGDPVPDAKTLWVFREILVGPNLAKILFDRFDAFLRQHGFEAKRGQIIDATIVRCRIRRDTPENNEKIKRGERVDEWPDATRRQKDTEARWTKKNGESSFGYKNHVDVDVGDKFVRGYEVTPASVHDSNVYESIITPNADVDEYADSAYGSTERVAGRAVAGKRGHFQEKGQRGHPLTEERRAANRERSRIRSRVEHVFGIQFQRAGNLLMRTVGLARARTKIGLRNLAYNLERYGLLRKRAGGGVGR